MSTKEEKVEKLITYPLEYLIIKAHDEKRRGEMGTRYTFDYAFREGQHKESETKHLKEAFNQNTPLFLNELINVNLGHHLITEAIEGSGDLLPSRFAHFYNNCIRIKTKQFTCYVTDLAIIRLKSELLSLYKRSQKDVLKYGNLLINSHSVGRLELSYLNMMRFHGHKLLRREPFKATYHTTLDYMIYDHGTKMMIESMCGLLDSFTKEYGQVEWWQWCDEKGVGRTTGGYEISLSGVTKEHPVNQKILSLLRQRK